MKRLLLSFGVVLCLSGLTQGKPAPDDPGPFRPEKARAELTAANGKRVLLLTAQQLIPQTRSVAVVENGVQVTKNVTVYVPVLRQQRIDLGDKTVSVIGKDGKALSLKVLTDRLRKSPDVLVTRGKAPDPRSMRNVPEAAVILVLPRPAVTPPPPRPEE